MSAWPVVVGEVPHDLEQVRRRLHVLAANVVTPARYRATGRIGLRWEPGGFATPPFEAGGSEVVVRVEGDELAVLRDGAEERSPLTTLGAAATQVLGQDDGDLAWAHDLGVHDVPDAGAADHDVSVAGGSARWLGDWFGLAWGVLNGLRDEPGSIEASEPQIWPEHFDAAIEVLPAPRRASYGFSPGDDGTPEPYAYVSIWSAMELGIDVSKQPWGAPAFPGAAVLVSEVRQHADQAGFLLDWFRRRRDVLASTGNS